ncbi:hypothetical protein RJ640_002661 [Escallonia rubra]|uniref:WAT1-related protein n=1 Tax=Escallonia rubra TaxID=112253 RepID=A0AA88S5E5_9ASTE|nr:hypothetical protein RJ640_002661 [Escallonia rubra]
MKEAMGEQVRRDLSMVCVFETALSTCYIWPNLGIDHSVLGAVIIICGLYVVLWGKGKELRRIAQLMPSRSSKEEPEQIQISARPSVESASIFAPTFFTMVDSDTNTNTNVNNNVSDQGLPVSHESRLEEGKEGETGKLGV